ncbi:hypothetical protein ACGFNV_00410 [Streptomyces sp. NPDC048751]|uniref:hypothetical protein n=1 Tax=Streptomyces sp. NPDC048751 TaxID=3365591 RepID=UPI003716DEFB
MAMRRTVRIALRIDRVVLDADAAAGHSPARIAALLTEALRARLPAAADGRTGDAPTGSRTAVDRLRVTADSPGVDAIARAAAAAVGEMTRDTGVTRSDSGTGTAPAAQGGAPR